MLLPGIALFPHSLVPLYIFEPRYRRMLNAALENDRLFCIAMPREPDGQPARLSDLHPVGGVGVVRACVRNADDTANLILQGVARLRFTSLKLDGAYPVVGVEKIATCESKSPFAGTLKDQIVDLIAEACRRELPITPQINECVRSLDDTDAVADLLAGAIVADPLERLILLEEPNTVERLKRIHNYLERALAEA